MDVITYPHPNPVAEGFILEKIACNTTVAWFRIWTAYRYPQFILIGKMWCVYCGKCCEKN